METIAPEAARKITTKNLISLNIFLNNSKRVVVFKTTLFFMHLISAIRYELGYFIYCLIITLYALIGPTTSQSIIGLFVTYFVFHYASLL